MSRFGDQSLVLKITTFKSDMTKTAKLSLCALLIFMCACNQSIDVDPDTGFEVFTIPVGGHSSIIRNEAFNATGANFRVIFDESARYTLDVVADQEDINKLIGFSDCGQHHQSESARIGWRWFNDELQILAYTYREGNLSFELMGAIPLNTEISLSIQITNSSYKYTGTGLTPVTIPRTADCEVGDNYWLWPYFGGDQPAPHEITIKLKRELVE